MRLIDADAFKQQMAAMALISPSYFTNKVVKLLEIIDEQPTAYNVEEVVKELKREAWSLGSYDVIEHYCVDLVEAIEIVKGGMKNGGNEI